MPIINYDNPTLVKIALLATQIADGKKPLVAQVVKIQFPSPTGARWYSSVNYGQLNGYKGQYTDPLGTVYNWGDGILAALGIANADLTVNLINGSGANHFVPIGRTSTVGDDKITLQFADPTFAMALLYKQHGGDIPVTVYRYFPEVDLAISHWTGYLDAPTKGGARVVEMTASLGYRSRGSDAPSIIANEVHCQALAFPAEYPEIFDTIAKSALTGCDYNDHVGGPTGIPGRTSCPQIDRSDCIANIGDALSYIGSNIESDTHVVSQSRGGGVAATVQGNESIGTQGLPVFMGDEFIAHELSPHAITPETNTKHPDQAALRTLRLLSIGPIGSISDVYVNSTFVQPQNINIRLGYPRQSPTGYSANVPNYSRFAHYYAVVFGNWSGTKIDQVKTRAKMTGGVPVKRWTDEDTYTEGSSANRAANLYTFATNVFWANGDAEEEYLPADWATLSDKSDENVQFTDFKGRGRTTKRASFNELIESRSRKQIIRDFCLWGGYSLPFHFNSKKRIMYLGREADLDAVPTFRDFWDGGTPPNIIRNGENQDYTTVTWTPVDPASLTYVMRCKFYDKQINYKARRFTVRDKNYQLDAGRKIQGIKTRKGERDYSLFGIVNEDEAWYHAERVYYLGEFDGCSDNGPGLLNALPVNLTVTYADQIQYGLHEYKVIRVLSEGLMTVYPGIEYFRIAKMQENNNLHLDLTCVPYVDEFYDRETAVIDPPVDPGIGNPYIGGGIPYSYGPSGVTVGPSEISMGFLQL